MSDVDSTRLPPLGQWFVGEGRILRADVETRRLDVAPAPDGGVTISEHVEGIPAHTLRLPRDVALALAAQIVAATGPALPEAA